MTDAGVATSAVGEADVMGTMAEVAVVAPNANDLLARARRQFEQLERAWNPLHANSEINRLNDSGGRGMVVSGATLALVEAAVSAWYLTGRRFDPTLVGDFALRDPATGALRRGCGEIELDTAASIVRMPVGVGFDASGIARGLAADLVVRAMREEGASGVYVNVGGDVRVSGAPLDARAWRVPLGVRGATPPAPSVPVIELTQGAVATSGSASHYLDPATGAATHTDVARVSIVATQAWQAQVLTKAMFVAGSKVGLEIVETLGSAAMVTTTDGKTLSTASFRHYGAFAA
ncbi:MAG: thiamine biosynthesis lipoprotein ApbE [Actinomycetia bacterium]|nr:thiamine biosynthesis lipoprotein ApbE [Actinomycetes bacterium]